MYLVGKFIFDHWALEAFTLKCILDWMFIMNKGLRANGTFHAFYLWLTRQSQFVDENEYRG